MAAKKRSRMIIRNATRYDGVHPGLTRARLWSLSSVGFKTTLAGMSPACFDGVLRANRICWAAGTA